MEPLDQFLNVVDPGACQLINFPERIWVFGGPCNLDKDAPMGSLRDSFWRQTLSCGLRHSWLANLDRPENYQDWWAFSGYDDLLEFERDACYLARAIVLFSESPGAHAELGALAIDDAILPRLFVVVQSKYLREDSRESFLNLGPINRVHRCGARCVIGSGQDKVLPQDDFEVITEEIAEWLKVPSQSAVFHPNNPTHRLLLLADLVDLLLVSKISDLQRVTDAFDLKLGKKEIERAATLLDFFGFITLEHRGKEPFLVRRKQTAAPWVNYKAKEGERFDRSRFKVAREAWLETDRRRSSIFAGHK